MDRQRWTKDGPNGENGWEKCNSITLKHLGTYRYGSVGTGSKLGTYSDGKYVCSQHTPKGKKKKRMQPRSGWAGLGWVPR